VTASGDPRPEDPGPAGPGAAGVPPSRGRNGDDPVRVLVVDDQELIREGIASLLEIQPGISVVGRAADGKRAVEAAGRLQPDVVLMDVRMPVMDGVQATAALRQAGTTARIVMLTTFDDEEYVLQALHHGASGYLLKDLPAADLADAVRLVHAGVAQFDAAVAGRLSSALRPPATVEPQAVLTARELQLLRLVAKGATNREIAAELYLSEGTVKNGVSRILSRLGLRDRTHAAIFARDRGLL
jgi:DNA-binding NarL/FixJ family response regulator